MYSEDVWLKSMYTVTVLPDVFAGRTGRWIIGIRQLNQTEHDQYDSDTPLKTVAPLTGRITSNYTLRAWTSTCGYMEATSWQNNQDNEPIWLSDGMTVIMSSRTFLSVHPSHLRYKLFAYQQ